MSSVNEIRMAIEGLSAGDRQALLGWLLDADRQIWDRQIVEDFAPKGPGARCLADVDQQIRTGNFRPL